MLYFLKLTEVCLGCVAVTNLAIAPRLVAQPNDIPVQVSYSKLDVNAVDLYYSNPIEPAESSNSEESVDLDNATDQPMLDDSSEDTTSLQ